MADLAKVRLNGTTYNLKDAWVRNAVANINPFSIQIVQSLPSSNIDTHTFYLISNGGAGQNIYDEYLYVNNSWEKIGSINASSIDMTDYLKKTDIAAWAKESTKPSYTASEVGALSSNTTYVSSVNGQSGAVTVSVYDDTALAARVSALENTNWYRYYTGSAAPSNSQGENGDLYFQQA